MKIVVLISIRSRVRIERRIQIEKWELAPIGERRPSTRAFPNDPNFVPQNRPQIPTKVQEIVIDQNTVTGAPLVLEFQKIFLRPAMPPESDITFTEQELSDWAADFWEGLN